MPPKTNSRPDQNTILLWHCLQTKEDKNIDYDAVATAMGIKVGAVRMRFSRLKKAIEATMAEQAGGEEEGGAGEAGGSEKAGKKRKREETAEVDGK